MPESRKRPGHPYQKPADIPASQRTTGHLLWALLVGIFGLMIGYFASNGHVAGMIAGALAGGAVGWWLGRKMERDAKKKD